MFLPKQILHYFYIDKYQKIMLCPYNYFCIVLTKCLIFLQDLLIGAPYDGEDHRGAIYVYLGSSERKASGKDWSYAQVKTLKNCTDGVIHIKFTSFSRKV